MRTLHLGPEELLVAAKIAVQHDDTAAEVATRHRRRRGPHPRGRPDRPRHLPGARHLQRGGRRQGRRPRGRPRAARPARRARPPATARPRVRVPSDRLACRSCQRTVRHRPTACTRAADCRADWGSPRPIRCRFVTEPDVAADGGRAVRTADRPRERGPPTDCAARTRACLCPLRAPLCPPPRRPAVPTLDPTPRSSSHDDCRQPTGLQGRRPLPGRLRPQGDHPRRARDARPDVDPQGVRRRPAAGRRPRSPAPCT